MSDNSGLGTRIRQEIGDLRHVVDRVAALLTKAASTGDPDYLDGVALNVHAFYTGVEHVLETVAREIDGAVPSGPDWHRDLLLQISGPIDDLRPPVLSDATRRSLEPYRGFRHVVRNIYAYNLDPLRVRQLGDDLPACFRQVAADLAAFADFLDALG